jgi:hypothetical protein
LACLVASAKKEEEDLCCCLQSRYAAAAAAIQQQLPRSSISVLSSCRLHRNLTIIKEDFLFKHEEREKEMLIHY